MVDAVPHGFPICCKIRLLPTVAETIKLCRLLRGAGCRLVRTALAFAAFGFSCLLTP
jgi:hypothetical protein